MASIADLIKGLKKLDDQSFRPGDSLIASTINHPVDALSQLGKYLAKQTNTAAGIPEQYDNPYPLLAPSPDAQSQAAFDVAGMAQLGGMPFAPKSAGGTVGTLARPAAASDNLNESLLQKYLQQGSLTPDELAQYERNAIAMRDSNRQFLNVANADAQGGTAMDRARDMGFDTDVIHGTSSNIKSVETKPRRYIQPFYVTENNSDASKALANSFSETKPEMGSPTIYPLKTKSSEVYDTRVNDVDFLKKIAEEEYSSLGLTEKGLPGWGQVNNWATGAKNNGINSVLIDERPNVNSIAIFDPSIIRSRFAAFDPLRKDSADLLATKLLPATMLGWGMYNEKKKRSLADLLGAQ